MVDLNKISWSYLAEGNANIILHNVNERKVLRVRKEEVSEGKLGSSKKVNAFDVASMNTFINEVVFRLFGTFNPYISPMEKVPVTPEFFRNISDKIKLNRPPHRIYKDIDFNAGNAQLMLHAGLLPKGLNFLTEDTVSVEIKPKWGFLPFSDKISEAHGIKKSVCRFCMHQETKLIAGKIKKQSEYCPLDLYGGCSCSVLAALKALFIEPQNNLRISLSGESLPVDYFDGQRNVTKIQSTKDLIKVLVAILQDDAQSNTEDSTDCRFLLSGVNKKYFCSRKVQKSHAVDCSAMQDHGLLAYLRTFQALDELDIEEVYKIYKRISKTEEFKNQTFSQFMDFNSELWKTTVDNIHQGCPSSNETEDLCRFLISSTMKDCSLVVSFQYCTFSEVEKYSSECELRSVKYNGSTYYYQIKLIDLDPYFVQNIPWSHSLDHEIVMNFLMKTAGKPCCTTEL